jgi:hypothetical protein
MVILLSDAGLDGEIQIRRSPFTPASDFITETLRYREAAVQSLPAGATGIEFQPPALHPYPYNGWKSLGFSWTYAFFGRPVVRTVSYINLEIGIQIVVTTQAAKNDAEKVGAVARQFMSSWWVMKDG